MIESALVSCEWLQQHLGAENQLILDATFFLHRQHRNAQKEYGQQHLPNAVFFDIDAVADLSSSLAHMLPTAEQFADAVGKMGVTNDTRVLIYDNNHFFAAARVWWMFRVFGHRNVRIIDGGMVRWKQLNFPVNSEKINPTSKIFKAKYHPELVFDLKQMKLAQRNKSWQIIDARSADSFMGQGKLTDTVVKQRHILGSVNIPYAGLTEEQQQTLLTNQKLQARFDDVLIDFSKPIVTTCGSGVSACVLVVALYQLGLKEIAVYDGSWAEWVRQETNKLI